MHQARTLVTSALAAVSIIFGLVFGPGLALFLMTAADREQSKPIEAASSPDALQSCWLAPETLLPWPNATNLATFELVYNTQADEFMALGTHNVGGWDLQTLFGARLSTTGQLLSDPEPVLQYELDVHLATRPAVAYSPVTNRYLVVWDSIPQSTSEREPKLMAQMVGADLAPIGDFFWLDTISGYWPAIAYNSDDDEFLVVARGTVQSSDLTPPPTPEDTPTADMPTVTPISSAVPPTSTPQPVFEGIYAQRVGADGTTMRPVVALTTLPSPEEVSHLQVVYNSISQEYLVVWLRTTAEAAKLYGMRLSPSGEPAGAVMTLAQPPTDPYWPFMAYNSADNQYLLVWAEAREPETRLADVYGQLLSAQGEPLGEPFVVRGAVQYEALTGLVYNPAHNEYLVAWVTPQEDVAYTPALQRLSASGEPVGDPIETAGAVFGLGVDTERGNYLVMSGYSYLARPLGFEPDCPSTPPPAESPTPVPTPEVLRLWQGKILDIVHLEELASEQWLIEGKPELVVVHPLTRLDEHLARAEVGAHAWVAAHEEVLNPGGGFEIKERVVDMAVILPSNEATAPPTMTMTLTPTVTTTATVTFTPTSTPTTTPTSQSYQHRVYLSYLARSGGSN